jgi:acetyltransferase EpsM
MAAAPGGPQPGPVSVLVVGAGGHGKEVALYLRQLRARGWQGQIAGFVDDHRPPGPFAGHPVLGPLDALPDLLGRRPDTPFAYITAVGDNRLRARFVERIEGLGLPNLAPFTLCHPDAQLGDDSAVGEGSLLAPGTIVTSGARIGPHSILNVKASVSHDSVVGAFVNLNPGATVCGSATLGEGCSIGAGATVIQKVSVGAWTVVGAGAVVVRDLPPNVTAVGVPARIIKRHPSPVD